LSKYFVLVYSISDPGNPGFFVVPFCSRAKNLSCGHTLKLTRPTFNGSSQPPIYPEKKTHMNKAILLIGGLLVAMTGYSQINGTGPLYTDDQLGLGFTSTTGINAQLHTKTTGSLAFRVERYVSAFNNQNNTFDIYFTSNPVNFTGAVAPGSTIFQTSNANADMLFIHGNSAGNTTTALFLKANGNVGIGQITASERLDVNGNLRINNNKLYFRGAGDVNHGIGYNALGYSVDGPVLFGYNGGLLASYNGSVQKAALRWDNNGNVSIGTFSTYGGTRLTIGGAATGNDNMFDVVDQNNNVNFRVKASGYVYARDITVQVGIFPDFVFDSTYHLMPIHDLGNYVKIYHHLPGVPTAATVQQNGMSVGEMNVLLLQKVEELTLYMVELQKQIDALQLQQAQQTQQQH
jgi:hypothetical protein